MTTLAITRPRSDLGVGLWVFIGVATTLFALFVAAYVMRMGGSDWSTIALPWQLALSTGLLVAGSVALQLGARHAARSRWAAARTGVLVAGACAAAFLASQLWAWQVLQAAQVRMAGNPAASFFYLLTAMHGLHVIGGLVAWSLTARRLDPLRDAPRAVEAVRLCARYWHFLLAVWLLLLATLTGITPAVVAFVCGSPGVAP